MSRNRSTPAPSLLSCRAKARSHVAESAPSRDSTLSCGAREVLNAGRPPDAYIPWHQLFKRTYWRRSVTGVILYGQTKGIELVPWHPQEPSRQAATLVLEGPRHGERSLI